VDGWKPPLTKLGGKIHRMAISIAPLTERESVQSSAVSSFTAQKVRVEDAVDSLMLSCWWLN